MHFSNCFSIGVQKCRAAKQFLEAMRMPKSFHFLLFRGYKLSAGSQAMVTWIKVPKKSAQCILVMLGNWNKPSWKSSLGFSDSKKLKRTNFVPNHHRATSIKVFAKYFFSASNGIKSKPKWSFKGGLIAHIFFPSIGNDDHDDDNDKISVISWTYAASFVKQCFNVNVFLMIFAKVCREMKWVKECEFALVLQIKYFIWKTVETKEILKN